MSQPAIGPRRRLKLSDTVCISRWRQMANAAADIDSFPTRMQPMDPQMRVLRQIIEMQSDAALEMARQMGVKTPEDA